MWQPVAAVRGRTPSVWWRTLVTALAVVVLIVGFVAVASALSSADTSFVVAQLISRGNNDGGQPRLVATGFGRATAPAETATLQLVIVPSGDQFNGSGFQPTPQASPETGDTGIAAPVVDAVVDQGVNPDMISVVVSPVYGSSSFYGGSASTGFQIDIHLSEPSADFLAAVMTAAYAAASDNRLYVAAQGIDYGVSDCDALEQEARNAAIDDARRQAEQQATALNAELGNLVNVSDAPPGAAVLASCETRVSGSVAAIDNPYVFNPTGLTLEAPAYDPAGVPEAATAFRVELTYVLVAPSSPRER